MDPTIQVEPEVYSQGETAIITFPFQQDTNFSVDKILSAERIIHDGETFSMKLNPKFNSLVAFQPAEATDLPFKIAAWNQESDELTRSGTPWDVARRIVLRKRFPLTVDVVDGVIYSPGNNVVCESLGKIHVMKQQLIPVGQVFHGSPPPSVQRQPDAARGIAERHFFPPTTMDQEQVELLANMSQGKPLTRIPLQRETEDEGPGPSMPGPSMPGPSMPGQIPLKKRPRVELEPEPANQPLVPRQSSQLLPQLADRPNHQDLVNAMQTIQQFFGQDLMTRFNIPGDRAARNIDEQEPSPSTINYSYNQFHRKQGLRETNTTKLGYYKFGQQNRTVSLFLYKTKNKYTGHNVPMSLREGAVVVNSIILTMMDAFADSAESDLERARSDANSLDREGREEAIRNAEATFHARMRMLG